MARLKELLGEITVSSAVGADYVNLSDAIFDISSIKTFRIESAIVLTANIIIPAGCTIIIGTQGSISGAFTLTGNETVLVFEGYNAVVATSVTFAGSWICNEITAEQFGAVGNGVTDDLLALNKAHSFARLSTGKRVVFSRTYKISDFITVQNTHSDFRHDAQIIGTNGKAILKASGFVGTFYSLDSDAAIGSQVIYCSNAGLLASLSSGDIVHITSNADFVTGYSGYHQGELHRVESVGIGLITLSGRLRDTYNVSNTAKVAKATMAKYSNSGLCKVSMPIVNVDYATDRVTDGIILSYIDSPDLNLSVSNCANASIQLNDCFEPRVHMRTYSGKMEGLGYGIAINGATMGAKVWGSAIGHRAGFDTGGSINGVPWDVEYYGCIATVCVDDDGAGFLSHYNVGSISHYDCRVIGSGVSEIRHAGFTLNARHNRLFNCGTHNIYQGIFSTGTAMRTVEIINFSGINCQYGLTGTTDASIGVLTVNGFNINNDSVLNGVAFYLNAANVAKWSFRNISINNLVGVFSMPYVNANVHPAKLVVDGLSHRCDSAGAVTIQLYHPNVKEVILNNFVQENCDSILYANAAATGLRTFIINNALITGSVGVKINEIVPALDLLRFVGCIFKDPLVTATKLALLSNGVTTFSLVGCHTEGSNMIYLTDVVNGKPFTNFHHVGNSFIGLSAAHKTQTPTNTITSGSIGL